MIYIYQILGDIKLYNPSKFIIKYNEAEILNNLDDKNRYELLLSSIFIYKNLKSTENKKIIFLRPISLDLDNETISSYIEQNFLSTKDYEIVDIPSYGMYGNKTYDYYPNEILLSIFIDMVERISIDDKIFIDVNTGLNEYVTLLIAATTYLMVTLSLKNIRDEKILEVYEIISDPMVKKTTNYTSLFIQKINRKIFFSLPYTSEMKISPLIEADSNNKSNFENKFAYKKYYKKIITELTIIFNTIMFNALPFISTLEDTINDDKYSLLLNAINEIIKHFKEVLYIKDNREIKVKDVYRLINFIMDLEFYQGLIDLLKDKLDDVTNLDKLSNMGEKIYKNKFINLPSNYEFLKRDIGAYENDLDSHEEKDIKSNGNAIGSAKRNFFAHSGMDFNSCKICDRRIIYDLHKIDERKKWLLNP